MSNTKPTGWFSRRHKTPDAHLASVAKYQQERGPTARKRRAAERLAATAKVSS